MQIEEGKFYGDEKGQKQGPMEWDHRGGYFFVRNKLGCWLTNGRSEDERTRKDQGNLISEWTTGPVITETMTIKKIIPGVYDFVTIEDHPEGGILIGLPANNYNAPELTAAIETLTAVRDALESQS